MYFVFRNNQQYGPYSLDALQQYVEAGQLLLHDKACDENKKNDTRTVKYFLKQNNVRVKIPHKGGLFAQIKEIGGELIFPKDVLQHKSWTNDKRLLLLALVGLVPLASLTLTGWLADVFPFAIFYVVSLYFATVWGLFFFYFFRTPQVKTKTTIALFFISQLAMFTVFGILHFVNPFYALQESGGFITRLLFFVFAVGITEELTKAIPVWIIASRAQEPLVPQTLVFYGLISGLAFGVFEGVEYQMTVNAELDYTSSFFLNIARLTSLPFLHAIWCGIAGYFSAFAMLYPKYRKSLYFLAITVPALLHGIYDTLGGNFLGVLISLVGVGLLMTYLRNGLNYQSKLRS